MIPARGNNYYKYKIPHHSLSASLPQINSTCQRGIADKFQEKSCLSANWVQTESVCWQVGVVYPNKDFL